MRFSIWPSGGHRWDETLALARHCEATGWDGVWFADHFMPNTGPEGPPADGSTLECWSVLAGLAAGTERLRVGSLVTGNTYRHPAVLAKVASAVDHISHGRAVLGIGAGWQVNEHVAYGIELPGVRERLDRLEEAAQVLLGLLHDDSRTTVAGRYYSLTDAPNDPKPVQARLPLLVGGAGEQRTMLIAARYADEWNAWTTPEVMVQKRDVLRRHCEGIGRDPTEIRVSTQAFLFLSDDEDWLAQQRPPAPGLPAMRGNADQVAETVAGYAAAGVDELIVPDWTMGPLERRRETYDRFMAEVVAQVS